MDSLELRFDGPIPKHLRQRPSGDHFINQRIADKIYHAKLYKKGLHRKSLSLYPLKGAYRHNMNQKIN
jgi:hypothetical protein